MNFRRSITILTGANLRGSGTASVEELISGNNSLSIPIAKRTSVQGIVRSRSYHWN